MRKNKKEKFDENGNPIQKQKKPINGKAIVKKAIFGTVCAAVGVITFVMVGTAMVVADDAKKKSDSFGFGDGLIPAEPETKDIPSESDSSEETA